MSYQTQLINKYMSKMGYSKDKQVIDDIGISKAQYSRVKHETQNLTDEQIALMCEKAGFDTLEEIANCHIETAKSPKLKEVWTDLAKKIKASAAAVILGFVLVGVKEKSPEPAFL